MKSFIVRVLITACIVVIGFFLLSLVSVISQAASFADRALPGSAVWVFWGLFLFFFGLLAAPLYFFFLLPKAPIPPKNDDKDAYKVFLEKLRKHLESNPRLSDMKMMLASNAGIDPALSRLEEEADKVIKDTASSVFLGTAVMQNGRLDALLVLACQLRMVWRIAEVFYSRPSPRHILYLYGNVGSNVLIADNIQQIDFASITTPIIVSIFPSVQGAFPGLQGISTLLINSLANGAANAFLTLRVGLIAKTYCKAQSMLEKDTVRKDSTSKSLKLVKDIVNEHGKLVANKVWDIVNNASGTMIQGVTGSFKDAARKTVEATADTAKTVSENLNIGLGISLDASGRMLQSVKEAIEEVRDTINNASEAVTQVAKDAVEKMRDTYL